MKSIATVIIIGLIIIDTPLKDFPIIKKIFS